jgi:hypothetical protein
MQIIHLNAIYTAISRGGICCPFVQMLDTWTRLWPETPLISIADISTACLYQLHDWPNDHLQPVLTIQKMTDRGILLSDTKYVQISERELLKFRLKKGDILFNHKTSLNHIGKSLIFNLDETVLHTKYLRIRPSAEIDSQFLQFILRMYKAEGRLRNITSGRAALSSVTRATLGNLTVPLPPLDIQRKILMGSENQLADGWTDLSFDTCTLYQ